LYQLRSKITTSPAAGKCGRYRWMYICDFSRSVGTGRATIRNTRGLTRSVIRLIVPPFPAVSRPSNTMQILGSRGLDPLLHGDELAMQEPHLLLILLALHLRRRDLHVGLLLVVLQVGHVANLRSG
jgi:hypothetical protein